MGVSFLPKSAWLKGGQLLLNTFLSTSCLVCERSAAASICQTCQRQLNQYRLATAPQPTIPGLPVIAWATYEGSLRQMIARLKYDNQPAIAQLLGTELGLAWLQAHPGNSSRRPLLPALVIPIPLHQERLQKRGFNQAELIATWFCRVTGLPMMADGLRRVQATTPQHGLNRRDRHHNLRNAFALNPARQAYLQQHSVWLIDDIFTTGATAQAAAQTLRRHQISVAGLGAVAITPEQS